MPYPEHAHPGYRFLFEYFHFAEKFYFFDIDPIDLPEETSDITLYISLADSFTFKANAITAGNFRLNCTPIVNLFTKTSEPIRLNHQTHEYRLIGDLKHEKTTEIHSITQVQATVKGTTLTEVFKPYFSYDHQKHNDQGCFWNARRVPAVNYHLGGGDIFLSLVDQNMDPTVPANQTIFAQLLCTNRTLASEFSAGTLLQPEQENPAAQIVCLYRPTPQYYPSTEASSQWKLISQLSLNHLSLSNDTLSLQALKEIIQLYAGGQNSNTLPELETISRLETKTVMRRFGQDAWRGFISGTHIRLTVNLEKDVQKNTFLFSSVLNHFFALFASVNSFTQLELYQHNNKGSWKTWSPMSGSKPLL
ncbi:MAG: type VI secretion system baseplate subunit TssF [Janthinobacterium lividum]